MMSFLRLIRVVNLVMIVITQYLIKYTLFPETDSLSTITFSLLVLATVCIAAAGNSINDVYDIVADKINKPFAIIPSNKISKKNAIIISGILGILGITLGTYVSFSVNAPKASLLFVGLTFLLWLYSKKIKAIPLLSNIMVAAIVASSIFIVGWFEYTLNDSTKGFEICLVYTFFAFWLNLMREIVKDIQDVNGDYAMNITTIPIILGRTRTGKLVAILAGIFIAFLLYTIHAYLQAKNILVIYILVTLLLPTLFFIFKMWHADSVREFRFLSLFLKLIMLFGIASLLLVHYSFY